MTDPRETFDEIARRLTAAVAAAAAEMGLEFDGELRGVVREAGRPETGCGLGAPVGRGLPAGWAPPTAAETT